MGVGAEELIEHQREHDNKNRRDQTVYQAEKRSDEAEVMEPELFFGHFVHKLSLLESFCNKFAVGASDPIKVCLLKTSRILF